MASTSSQAAANPLRVAIIGYGLAGAVFHAPLISATPGMRVAAIVTNSQQRAAQARRNFPDVSILSSTEEIWRDPTRYDLVVVATPNRAHVPLGMAALNAGVSVVIDKPFATSVADAEKLIEESKRAGKLLTVFQNRRWDNDFLTARKVIESDLLGRSRASSRGMTVTARSRVRGPGANMPNPKRAAACSTISAAT